MRQAVVTGLAPHVRTPLPPHLQAVRPNAPQNPTPPRAAENKALEYAKVGSFGVMFLVWAFVSFLPFVFMVWLAMKIIDAFD